MAQKTVLVTGGARGIGRGTAMLLAGRGYRVAVADLERGGELPFFRCDVSREPSVKRCVRAVLERFGRDDEALHAAPAQGERRHRQHRLDRALQSEPDTEAYAATKGGVVALTHALAMSLGPAVRVNCISPGWIASTRLRRRDHAQHPAGRAGRPADVGEMIDFLISDAAGFVTGQNFIVDGGMTRKMIYV